MALSVRASTQNYSTGSVTELACDKPTGTAEGDLLLMFGGVDGSNTFTQPSGWTAIETSLEPTNAKCAAGFFYKVAGASEPSTWTYTMSGSERCVGVVLAIQEAADSYNVYGTNSGTSADCVCPTITPTVSNTLLIAMACLDGGGDPPNHIPFTAPSGFSVQEEVEYFSSVGFAVCVSTSLHGSGATGTKTIVSSTSDDFVTAHLAIGPAAAGPALLGADFGFQTFGVQVYR